MLNKQELINANILVPILKNELEDLVSREQGRRVILIDGFPRNLEQQREFERAVSILGSKLAVAFVCVCFSLYTNAASSSQSLCSFCSSAVLKRSRNSVISRAIWKGERQMMRQCSRNDIRSICKRMRISYVNIGRGGS